MERLIQMFLCQIQYNFQEYDFKIIKHCKIQKLSQTLQMSTMQYDFKIANQ